MKKIVYLIYILGFFLIIFANYVVYRLGYDSTMDGLLYWYIVVGLLILILTKKPNPKLIFAIGLFLYFLSGFILTLVNRILGELFMRIGFIFLITGLLSAIDYKK